MELLGLLAIPFIVAAVSWKFLPYTITRNEFLLQVVASLCVGFISFKVAAWGSMQDTEYWHGRVVSKDNGTEGCCHCRTVCDSKDKNGNCTSSHTECDHVFDYWWSADISTGDVVHDGCNSWGDDPEWWTSLNIDDPATIPHTYTNYLLADPESLRIPSGSKKYETLVPEYPTQGSFQLASHRALGVGARVPAGWNSRLREMNAELGPAHQVDLMIVVTDIQDPDFIHSVESKWLYGPKNAFTVVMGINPDRTVSWAGVSSVSSVQELRIDIRDTLPGRSLEDPTLLDDIASLVATEFQRRPMSEFEYMESAATPRGWALFFTYLINILVACGLTYLFHREDIV